jgi:hypothetical protein
MQTLPDYHLDALFRSAMGDEAEALASTAARESQMLERVGRVLTRRRKRRQLATLLLAAALTTLTAAAIALGGSRLTPPVTPEPSPEASATPEPSIAEPSSETPFYDVLVHDGRLEAGTYKAESIGASAGHVESPASVRFTVPAGWTWNGSYLSKGGINAPDGAAIFFFNADQLLVYDDPCHWTGAQPGSRTGNSVQDIVDALAAQPMRNATTPSSRWAGVPRVRATEPGWWPGLAIELTVPGDIDFADCDGGEFRSWGPDADARSHQGPGQRDLVWVVDHSGQGVQAEGARMIIDAATFPGTPAEVIAEIEAILDSLAVGHWG